MITVVAGACCAGKTTYVGARRSVYDVVIDMDALAVALGAASGTSAATTQRTYARRVRDEAVEYALTHPDAGACDVWVIHSRPSPAQVARYRARGARLVVLDPGPEECERRARADRRPRWTVEAIAEWYAEPVACGDDRQGAASRTW